MKETWLTKTFNVKYPIIMAPMFLVSNEEMIIEASKAGVLGCAPALNWRTIDEFKVAMKKMKESCEGPFGINLIVGKANPMLEKQIQVCEEIQPDFIITSLGSPKEVIKRLGSKGVKILCDVVDLKMAQKVESLGADALIAVNSGAGGHAGNIPASILVPALIKNSKLPVISAGGVGTGAGLLSVLALGSEGVSIGSPFIASKESPVSEEYKKACVDYGMNDIVLTTKISGTPCTVIKTPYVEKIGTEQNFVESFLNKNKKVKKYAKMFTYYKGMKLIEKAAFSASYKSVWCAGPSIEFVDDIKPVGQIVKDLIADYQKVSQSFCEQAPS